MVKQLKRSWKMRGGEVPFWRVGAWCLANLCGKGRFVREGTQQYKRFNQGG